MQVSSKAFNYYKYWIYKPITAQRRQEFSRINNTRFLFNQLYLDDSASKRPKIPPLSDYRDFAMQQFQMRISRRSEAATATGAGQGPVAGGPGQEAEENGNGA